MVSTYIIVASESYAIALNFGSDICQTKVAIVQVNTKSG